MASDTDAPDELSVPLDHVPGARGHGVLAVGSDGDGREALAVWRLSPTGRAGGSWVLRLDDVRRDPDRFGRIMEMLRGRCLIDWDAQAPARVLDRVATGLPVDLVATLKDSILTIPELLTEIGEQRAGYAEAIERHRATAPSKIAPLVWPSELPQPGELAERARAASRAAWPVTATALATAWAVATIVQLWQDTEQARFRRTYLRGLGDPQPLPPGWLARLRQAADRAVAVPA